LAARGELELASLREARDRVIARLSDHFASDDIDLAEFERRVDLAHRAAGVADLDALLADLPAPAGCAALQPAPAPGLALARIGATPEQGSMVAIMSASERKGSWLVPRRLRSVSVMGSAVIDFREVAIPPGISEITITAVMGAVQIIVPPELSVDMNGFAVMGAFEHLDRAPRTPDPGAPLLRVTGFCVMGAVSVETRLPGESFRDARRREKRERKQLVASRSAKEDE
jgi:hypothetical protein